MFSPANRLYVGVMEDRLGNHDKRARSVASRRSCLLKEYGNGNVDREAMHGYGT